MEQNPSFALPALKKRGLNVYEDKRRHKGTKILNNIWQRQGIFNIISDNKWHSWNRKMERKDNKDVVREHLPRRWDRRSKGHSTDRRGEGQHGGGALFTSSMKEQFLRKSKQGEKKSSSKKVRSQTGLGLSRAVTGREKMEQWYKVPKDTRMAREYHGPLTCWPLGRPSQTWQLREHSTLCALCYEGGKAGGRGKREENIQQNPAEGMMKGNAVVKSGGFIQIKFACRTIHSFKVYNLMVSSLFRDITKRLIKIKGPETWQWVRKSEPRVHLYL